MGRRYYGPRLLWPQVSRRPSRPTSTRRSKGGMSMLGLRTPWEPTLGPFCLGLFPRPMALGPFCPRLSPGPKTLEPGALLLRPFAWAQGTCMGAGVLLPGPSSGPKALGSRALLPGFFFPGTKALGSRPCRLGLFAGPVRGQAQWESRTRVI